MERETRNYSVELRVDADSRKITGYAAVFGQWSEDLGGFREKVRPGAFKKAIDEDDVRALFNHDPNLILGRNKSGTLRMWEDQNGLRIEIDPPDTQIGRDVVESLRRGDIDQMSFAFGVVADDWKKNRDGSVERELIEVRLFDVSAVTYPAYPQTSVSVQQRCAALLTEVTNQAAGDPIQTQQGLREIYRLKIDLLSMGEM